jgi:ABC-type glycerol-3-phosphate transport system permease component
MAIKPANNIRNSFRFSVFRGDRMDNTGDKTLLWIFFAISLLFMLACLFPFVLMIISSFTDEATLIREGYKLWPSKWSLDAYKAVLSGHSIPQAYKISITVTTAGTLASLVFTSLCAYAISGKQLRYRNIIAFLFYFSMLFSGGLVPTYILISKYLGLRDNLLVYASMLINPWNMFLMRNFFNTLPDSYRESAYLDGANDLTLMFRIIMPLSTPVMASIALFYALAYWNSWMESLLYMDNENLYTLQYLIMKIMRNLNSARLVAQQTTFTMPAPPAETIRYATALLTIGPIILLYPFLQRYFVKGLHVGGIKG